MLVMHGTDDTEVPFAQALELANDYRAAGATVDLNAVEDGRHLFRDEGPDQLAATVLRFYSAIFDEAGSGQAALNRTTAPANVNDRMSAAVRAARICRCHGGSPGVRAFDNAPLAATVDWVSALASVCR